jgi:two-component system OmpR family sensor kinase
MSWRRRSLSIYGRTFLLMLAALIVAEAIGLAFIVYRPPSSDAPVQLWSIARRLRLATDFHGGPDGPFAPPPALDDAPPPAGGPPGFPPSHFDPGHLGPGRLDPGKLDPGKLDDSLPLGLPPEPDLTLGTSLSAPLDPDPTLRLSEPLRTRLAQFLRVEPRTVMMFATPEDDRATTRNNTTLHGSFLAARQLPDGTWRTVERTVEGFPNALHRRAMLLFALGAATLLPLAWLFARALSAPIRRFSEAARRLGRDPNSPPVPREGPAEMLVAVDSFNSMQARLNRLIQERTHMVGAIAHDLRTPLTRLAFRLDDLPHPLREKVDADIQEMKSMISAALDFIRDRSLTGQQERLDFRLLVESVVDNQSDLGHDVTLQAGAPLTITGNPLALRRMVVNLVDNALKYGERARLRVRSTNDHCVLEVDDDGPGIPEQLQEQVFEPFFRLESSRNRDTGGIGLGLAAVRAIVVEHGGEITLGNRKSGGLRVIVSLPISND